MTEHPPAPAHCSERAPRGSDNVWTALRRLTAARIGLARSGASLATRPLLDFKLAHAQARDAVHEPLDGGRLAADTADFGLPVLEVASAAPDRLRYLMRPDLGRCLTPETEAALTSHASRFDVAIVIADGLSARAVQAHAAPVLAKLLPALRLASWRVAPLVIVRHGRVAIADRIATLLGADCTAVLIGERPGLTAPDSMGAYLTWRPGPQTTDAERNCVSNIRPGGIDYGDAVVKLLQMLSAIRKRQLSGVQLKDESGRRLDDIR